LPSGCDSVPTPRQTPRVIVVPQGEKMLITRRIAIMGSLALPLAAQNSSAPSSTMKVGDKAPDFTLPSTDGGTVHLADLLGKSTVVLAFFPAAFTGG
jgi:hypothetical protein